MSPQTRVATSGAVEISLTQEQRDLAASVRSLLSKRSDSSAVRTAADSTSGYDEALWTTLCTEIGIAGLAIPSEYGGADAGPVEVQVVCEELGRALTPTPLLGSAVLAAQTLLKAGDRDACQRLLPGIADGTLVAALAWCGPEGGWDPDRPACSAGTPEAGTPEAGPAVLDGEAHYVLNGDTADVLIVAASTPSGTGLFEVDPRASGVRCLAEPTMDSTVRLSTIRLTGARGRQLASGDGASVLRYARDRACVALSAEQVGAASRSLELTVEHAKQRRQFGRPIGGFQALKHRMAEAFVAAEAARSASYAAALSAELEEPGLERAAVVAKVRCSETLQQVTAEMVQLHGGIAITWEHDAQLYFKRAHSSSQLFGQPSEHVDRLAAVEGVV